MQLGKKVCDCAWTCGAARARRNARDPPQDFQPRRKDSNVMMKSNCVLANFSPIFSGSEVLYAGYSPGEAAGSFVGAGLFFCRDGSSPRSRSSKRISSKKIPETVSKMRLMNMPSTVVIEPARRIQTIPARGMIARTMESRSITARNRPPKISCAHAADWQVRKEGCSGPPPLKCEKLRLRLERGVDGFGVLCG